MDCFLCYDTVMTSFLTTPTTAVPQPLGPSPSSSQQNSGSGSSMALCDWTQFYSTLDIIHLSVCLLITCKQKAKKITTTKKTTPQDSYQQLPVIERIVGTTFWAKTFIYSISLSPHRYHSISILKIRKLRDVKYLPQGHLTSHLTPVRTRSQICLIPRSALFCSVLPKKELVRRRRWAIRHFWPLELHRASLRPCFLEFQVPYWWYSEHGNHVFHPQVIFHW